MSGHITDRRIRRLEGLQDEFRGRDKIEAELAALRAWLAEDDSFDLLPPGEPGTLLAFLQGSDDPPPTTNARRRPAVARGGRKRR